MTAGVEYDPLTSDEFFTAWGRFVFAVMSEGDAVGPEQYALFATAYRAGFDHGDSA